MPRSHLACEDAPHVTGTKIVAGRRQRVSSSVTPRTFFALLSIGETLNRFRRREDAGRAIMRGGTLDGGSITAPKTRTIPRRKAIVHDRRAEPRVPGHPQTCRRLVALTDADFDAKGNPVGRVAKIVGDLEAGQEAQGG
jgi:hypothetical protein